VRWKAISSVTLLLFVKYFVYLLTSDKERDRLEENVRLRDALDLDEKTAHENVKLLLRKYEHYRVKAHVFTYLLHQILDGLVVLITGHL